MKTIVEPKDHICKLWGKQQIRDGDTYRVMKYVLRMDYDGQVLLHNVVTGQLVVLEQEEIKAMDHMPQRYDPVMEQLVMEHYLVPVEYDEHQQVVSLRTILRKFDNSRKKAIVHYTILPTTACNARCYYCFEHGTKPVTMNEKTADEVVKFISKHSDGQQISIQWFGGEPTVAANRIDQISKGLQNNGIRFNATMISNGYLFDESMAERASKLWNLRHVQISVDGQENTYNEVKAFVNPSDNPYQRVMRNVGLLLDHGVAVGVRMNYDIGNYREFDGLLSEIMERFQKRQLLSVYSYPVIGEYPGASGEVQHGSDEWFAEKTVELNDRSRKLGLYRRKYELPHLDYKNCEADDDSAITINALGELVECPEHFDQEESVGNVWEGLTNTSRIESWKAQWEYTKCLDCVYYPRCVKLDRCGARDVCRAQDRVKQFKLAIVKSYDAWKLNN